MNINSNNTCPINCPYNKIVKTRCIIENKHISPNNKISISCLKRPLGCLGFCKSKNTVIDKAVEKALLYLMEPDPDPPATNHKYIVDFFNSRTKELENLISSLQR